MSMELGDYFAIGRRWAWLFVLAITVAAAGAWVGTRFVPRTYVSATTFMVGRPLDDSDATSDTIYLSSQLAVLYSGMATREPVLQGVVDALGLEADWPTLAGMIKTAPQPGTPLFEIRVVAADPQLARDIAAETARQLIAQSPTERQRELMQDDAFILQQLAELRASLDTAKKEIAQLEKDIGLETSARGIAELQARLEARTAQRDRWQDRYAVLRSTREGGDVNALTVIEPATPGAQVGPNVRMNVLLAVLLAFGLTLGTVLLLEYLDDTVKTPEEVERRFGLPGLASVDRFGPVAHRDEGLITLHQPRSPIAESYRALRTNLQFALLQRPKGVLVITSSNPGEGKSTTAANLAVVLAQSGKRVVLVDADLRKPSLHRFFRLTNNLGLTSLLLDPELAPADASHAVDGLPNLRLLTSGPLPHNPAEVLGSDSMKRVVAALGAAADLVIVDTPPILSVTDASVIAGGGTASTLLVVDSGTTRTDVARKAIATLAKAGITPLGAVVNKLDRRRAGGYYRYAYDGYRDTGRGAYGDDGHDGGPPGDPEGDRAEPAAPDRSPAGRARGGWRQRLAYMVSSLMG